ncbi:MAG: sugar-binding domain-containing protein, partial [Bacteroidales bacterium]
MNRPGFFFFVLFVFPGVVLSQKNVYKGVSVNSFLSFENRIISLDGYWKLKIDPDHKGLASNWEKTTLDTDLKLEIPGSIQTLDELAGNYPPENGLRNSFLGTFWLERSFDLENWEEDEVIWLKIGGILPAGHIWVNGRYVDYHNFGPVSAKWKVTELVKPGTNSIHIAVVEQETGLIGGYRFAGLNWSGVYRSVEIEVGPELHLEELFINPDLNENKVEITGRFFNESDNPIRKDLQVIISEWKSGKTVFNRIFEDFILKNESASRISLEASWEDPVLWEPDNPFLYRLEINVVSDDGNDKMALTRFGYRSVEVKGYQILLNGKPVFLAGAGQEFFSPTLSPLTDPQLIKQRISALKSLGFNYFRCHTYPVTPEELAVADELGFMFCSEVSLVSNFGKTEPFDRGMEVLKYHILQTRNHPSLITYGLGNEGTQIMVNDPEERHHARKGYQQIKRYAPSHLGVIAFGLQGELPDLPNDFETPHLWSDAFTWAYDGLSRIPWITISDLMNERPVVVHEFGKFGVWPDEREESLYPREGYNYKFGTEARAALMAHGLEQYQDTLVRNSRKLFDRGAQTVIEQARIHGVDGYTMWTAFRGGRRNSGFSDDMGQEISSELEGYNNRNGQTALLTDLGFDNRVYQNEIPGEIRLFLSNYDARSVDDAQIEWEINNTETGKTEHTGRISNVNCPSGISQQVGSLTLKKINITKPVKAQLHARLKSQSFKNIENSWDIWIFPYESELNTKILLDIFDSRVSGEFLDMFPNAVLLKDGDSMIRGCRTWDGLDTFETIMRFQPEVIITDRMSPYLVDIIEADIDIIFYNTGNFQESWYGPVQDNQFS